MMPLPLLLTVACQQPLAQSNAPVKQQAVETQAQQTTSSRRQEAPSAMMIVRLDHAVAEDLQNTLQNLLPNRRGATLRVMSDQRLNAILLSGSQDQVDQAVELLKELDAPTEE